MNPAILNLLVALVAEFLWPLIKPHFSNHGPAVLQALNDKLQGFAVNAWNTLTSGKALSTQRLLANFESLFGIQLAGNERARFLSFIEQLEAVYQNTPEARDGSSGMLASSPGHAQAEPPILAEHTPANSLSTSSSQAQGSFMSQKELKDKVVNWIVPANLVARKLSPASLEGFFGAGGVQIEEGTRAAIIINGVAQHEVGPGIYQFARLQPRELSSLNVPNAITRCLDWMVGIFGSAGMKVGPKGQFQMGDYKKGSEPGDNSFGFFPQDITTFSVVICRSVPFEIELGLESLRGGNRNIAKVSVQISSIPSFLRWTMVESSDDYLSEISVAEKMQRKLGDRAHQILETAVQGDSSSAELAFQQEWDRLGADTGIRIVNLLGLASQAQQDSKDRLAKARATEEMLDVEIRLQKANNRLGMGLALAEDERQQIEAEMEKRGLARRFDLEKFDRDIESQRLVIENSIRILDQKLKAEVDHQQVELDGKIRARAANLEMDLKRIREIEGTKISSEADAIRRKSQIDLDALERDKRLESMKTLMEIRKDRDKATAGIDMEKMKLFKEMTPEQIMLVNPNVSREAAVAMAAKFSEEAQKEIAKRATEQADKMQQFLEKMAAEQREIVYAANGVRGPGPKRRKEDQDGAREKSPRSKPDPDTDEKVDD